jgi:hypothetical protein
MGFQVDPVDPEVMTDKSGGGCLVVIGLFVLLNGISLMYGFSGRPFFYLQFPRLTIGIAFGGIFVLIGALLLFCRRTVIIDRRRMVLVRRWTALTTLSEKEFPLGGDCEVTLTSETRHTKNSTYTVYPVRIKHNVSETIDMEVHQQYEDARRIAESLSRFLRVRLADSSTGTLIVREGDKVDESIRSQARRTQEEIDLPERPREMKFQVRQEGGGVVVEIPVFGSPYAALVQKVIFLVFLAFILFPLGNVFSRLFSFRNVWVYVAAGVVVYFVFRSMRRKFSLLRSKPPAICRVTANRQVFRYEEGSAQGEEIPADEIEEIGLVETESLELEDLPDGGATIKGLPEEAASGDYGTSSGLKGKRVGPRTAALLARLKASSGSSSRIVVRSDKKTIEFGMGLSKEELRYLLAVVKKALTG